MTAADFITRLPSARKSGGGWTAKCPAHEDRRASLSIREAANGNVLVKCFAGCTADEIVAALGLELGDLFPERGGEAAYPRRTPATVQHPPGCTLAAVRRGERASRSSSSNRLGLSEIAYMRHPGGADALPGHESGHRAVQSASACRSTATCSVKVEGRLEAAPLRPDTGSPQAQRGRLRPARAKAKADAQTPLAARIPRARPSRRRAAGTRSATPATSTASPRVYVVVEPDRGGEAVLRWLAASAIRDRVRLVRLDEAKDVSDLYLADRDRFARTARGGVAGSRSRGLSMNASPSEIRTGSGLGSRPAPLAGEPRILDRFARRPRRRRRRRRGPQTAKLLYLALTSQAARPAGVGRCEGAERGREVVRGRAGLRVLPRRTPTTR